MFESVKSGYRHHLNKQHAEYIKNPHTQHKHRAIFFGILTGILLAILTCVGIFMATYGEKAAPATFLANTEVTGKSKTELAKTAEELFSKAELTLVNGDIVAHAMMNDLGVTLDAEKTAEEVLRTGNEHNIFVKFNPFLHKDNNLVVNIDQEIMQNYLNEKFYDISTPQSEPVVAYKDNLRLFEVVPGKNGQVISIETVEPLVQEALSNPQKLIEKVELSEVAPIVSDESAGEARDYMNSRLGLRLNMQHNGRTLYFIDPWDIAAFAVFTVNKETKKFDVTFSNDKIKNFIDQKLAPSLSGAPVNEVLLVDKDGNTLMTITKGRNGSAPSNMDYLIEQIKQALSDNVPLNAEMDLTETAYKTEKIVTEDNRWIEYNISTFTLTLWDGNRAIWSTNNTANGKGSTPTITGSFRVYLKYSIQTMTGGTAGTGDYYNIPGVKWVTYWGPGGYAFHTASWLNGQERTNISHGCVNMYEADAKTVFDYASIGTRVVVHY